MLVSFPKKITQEFELVDPFQELSNNDNGFARFLEDETSKLRAEFVQGGRFDRDRDAYAQVFDSSIGLVKNTLEQIWYGRFQWNEDITRGVLIVEEKKIVLRSKMEDFQREMDTLPWWHRLPYFNLKIREKIDYLQYLIDELDEDIEQVDVIMEKEADIFWKERDVNKSKMDFLHRRNTVVEEALGILGKLRWLLLLWRLRALIDNEVEFSVLNREIFASKLKPIVNVMNQWEECLCGEVKRIKKTAIVVNRALWCGGGFICVSIMLYLLFALC